MTHPKPASQKSVFLIALATWLFHLLLLWLFPNPRPFRKYALAAEQALSGELPIERLMDFSPLYLRLSIWLEQLTPQPEQVMLHLQLLAVATTAGMFYAILRHRFSVRLSGVALVALVLDRHLLIYQQILEPEAFVLFFVVFVLFFVDRERPLVAGLGAALSLATRPNLLPVFLLVPLALAFRGERGRQLVRSSVAFLMPIALVLGLLMLRAAHATGDPTTPSMNPGTVFFEGNNPLSHGTSAVYPPTVLAYVQRGFDLPDGAHHHYRQIARAATGEELSIAEVNAFWAGQALNFIRQEPARFARLLLDKLVRCFHNFRWHDVPTAWRYDRDWLIPTVPFALIASLALLGFVFETRRWRESLLFYALAAVQIGVMLVFYVSARQRLALLPALLFFAAVAIDHWRLAERGRLVACALIALLTVTLMLPGDLAQDERYRRQSESDTEIVLEPLRQNLSPGSLARNREIFFAGLARSAWRLDWIRPPGLPLGMRSIEAHLAGHLQEQGVSSAQERFDLAVLQQRAGQDHEAHAQLDALRREGKVFYLKAYAPSGPRLYLSRLARVKGDLKTARALLTEGLELSPGDPFLLAERVALSDDETSRRTLLEYFSELDAEFLLAQAFLEHERWSDAEAASRFLIDRLPDFREAYVIRAVALGAGGQLEEGAQAYREALRFGIEPVRYSEPTMAFFRAWADAHPDKADAQLFAAQVMHQHGSLSEALARLESMSEPTGPVRNAIEAEKERLRQGLNALEQP